MNSTELPTFITVKELAVLLRTSTTSIYRKVPDWPHHRFGTVILFSESDVSAILQLGKVPPADRCSESAIPEETVRQRNKRLRRA